MKNKPCVYICPRQQKQRRLIAAILIALLLLSFIPLPWSLYGRTSLHQDGSIVQHSMFNRPAREFSSGDIADIQLETFRYSTGRHHRTTHWGVRLVFTTDSGAQYSFDHRDFRRDDAEIVFWISAMARLLGRYNPGIIHISGAEDLDLVVEERNLSEEEVEMLYCLFGQ